MPSRTIPCKNKVTKRPAMRLHIIIRYYQSLSLLFPLFRFLFPRGAVDQQQSRAIVTQHPSQVGTLPPTHKQVIHWHSSDRRSGRFFWVPEGKQFPIERDQVSSFPGQREVEFFRERITRRVHRQPASCPVAFETIVDRTGILQQSLIANQKVFCADSQIDTGVFSERIERQRLLTGNRTTSQCHRQRKEKRNHEHLHEDSFLLDFQKQKEQHQQH